MKTIVIEATPCPSCGKPMPAGALAGLCPACLLAQGVGTDAGDARKGVRFEPPSVAEVAKLFPQLEILGLLGAGGMGAVYKARQPVLDRLVALKVLPASGAEGVNFEERFNREARALARLSHPNIVAVHEFGRAESLHFFIMEFVDGANLRQLEQSARLAPREALQIIPQICDALQYAHDEGVVHRDIKPENVLIDRKGRVKIADFGLAKILGVDADSLRLTAEGQVMGTPHYMAPEQVEKPLAVDHRADIYSLGVVFYEMLTGDLPLGKFSPPSQKYQLDVRLDEVVLRALENDPARRYQQASEVKSRVETIAGTPAGAVAAVPAPEQNFIRWAGFPVVVEREGVRKVNRKEAFKMFAIFFGLLTVAFGLVSLITGRSLFGWLGISGALSLQVRLLIAAAVSVFGVWRAFRLKQVVESLPQTPQGTVILPPEKFSRKAIFGASWIPFSFVGFLLTYTVHRDVPAQREHAMEWWQILLIVTVLVPGMVAPFGTTILGWLAVSDIRRMNGRLSGLPLAVFDGLVFPLLALDGFLIWAWAAIVETLRNHAVFEPFHAGEVSVLTKLGAAAICVLVNLAIIRRVWRAVRFNESAPRAGGDWWWGGKRGALTIGLACVAIIVATGMRRSQPDPKGARTQVAALDKATGTQVATLGPRGVVELLAVSDAGAAPNEWWLPNGTAIPDTLYEFVRMDAVNLNGWTNKDFVLRYRDLPKGASGPQVEFGPDGPSISGGELLRDGKNLSGGWPLRAAFRPTTTEATIRAGFDIDEWQTVSTHDRNGNNQQVPARPGVPQLRAQVHDVTENEGRARVTMVMEKESRDWKVRVVAVDTNNVEHSHSTGSGTGAPGEKTLVKTYDFRYVPLARLKEFRVQVRPVHWIEFRGVALASVDRSALGKSSRPFKPTAFTAVKEVQITGLFDFDKGVAIPIPREMGTKSEMELLNSSWAREQGVDVNAFRESLYVNGTGMGVADLAPSEWNSQRPEKLAERLNRSLYSPPFLPYEKFSFPIHYAFRTRENGLGMMQLFFNQERTNLTVRYKMVERAHFE